MPATRTPRQMSARELDAAMQNYAKSVYENPLMPGNLVYRMLPEQFQEMYRAPLGAALSGISYLTDRGTVKDVPKDINKAGKAIAQNAGSYLDLFNTVYNAISGTPQQGDPNYYRVSAGEAYQQAFNPEPADPRLERALDMYADPLVAAGSARRAANVLTDPALYRQIADELGGANRAYAIENLWHGSPHTFDRFDLSKIGTGEGAQAYGHGAYLAESKGVGESYKASTSRPEIEVRGGVYKADDSGVFRGADGNTAGDLPDYLYYAMNGIVGSKPDISNAQLAEEVESFLQTRRGVRQSDIEKAKLAIINGEIVRRDTGNLYQTRLAWPDPAREAATPLKPEDFLDWDKPLSEQSQAVRDAWASFTKENPIWLDPSKSGGQYKNPAGKDFYGAVFEGVPGMGVPARSAVTEYMAKQGIPGIRYLDAGSRGAGEGSRNYVVFDDKLIDIVSRNNQPIKK